MTVYKYFNKYDEQIVPLSLSFNAYTLFGGYKNYGVPAATAAFILGNIDNLLKYNKIYQHKYLTSAFLGASAFTNPEKLLAYLTNDQDPQKLYQFDDFLTSALGGVVGGSVQTGIFQKYPIISSLAKNCFLGFKLAEKEGLILGSAASIFDEVFNYYEIFPKSYFSSIK